MGPVPAEGKVLAQIARAWKHGRSSEWITVDLDVERIPTKGEGRW
jgi:hypothetical protein